MLRRTSIVYAGLLESSRKHQKYLAPRSRAWLASRNLIVMMLVEASTASFHDLPYTPGWRHIRRMCHFW
jgi:hypothetical protein